MKKSLLSIFVVCLSLITVNAQTTAQDVPLFAPVAAALTFTICACAKKLDKRVIKISKDFFM